MPIFSTTERDRIDQAERTTGMRLGLFQQARAAYDSLAHWLRPEGSGKILTDLRTASRRLLSAARPAGRNFKGEPPQWKREPKPDMSVIDPHGNVIHAVSAAPIVETVEIPTGDSGQSGRPKKTDPVKGPIHSKGQAKKTEGGSTPAVSKARSSSKGRTGKKAPGVVTLVLLRHATALESGSPGLDGDEARSLDRKGRKEAKRVARVFGALGLEFDSIVTSPLQRALETAQIVAVHLGAEDKVELAEGLKPGGMAKNVIMKPGLRKAGACVLIVGHEPELSDLALTLLGAGDGVEINLRKGGALMLKAQDVKWGPCARLEWMLTPALIKITG